MEAVRAGNYPQAVIHARDCLRSAQECGFPKFEACAKMNLGGCYICKASGMPTHELIDEALQTARDVGTKWIEYAALALKAYACLSDGDEQGGLEYLSEELCLGRAQGYVNGPDTSWLSKRLCYAALEAGIEMEYTRKHIRLLGITPDERAQALENWPWPVKVYT